MIVWTSEDALRNRVRELNNLGSISDNDLLVTFDHHLRKLGRHLQEYGLVWVGMSDDTGNGLIAITYTLKPSFSESDRQARLDGLRFLGCLACTVQRDDAPALVLNRVSLAGIQQIWPHVADTMERIQIGEIEGRLEDAAMRSLSGATLQGHVGQFDGLPSEQSFQLWCIENNLPCPDHERRNQEIREAAHNASREAAREKAVAEQIEREERNSANPAWGWREL